MSSSMVQIELDDTLLTASRDAFTKIGTNTVDAVRAFLHFAAFHCNDPKNLQPIVELLENFGDKDSDGCRQSRCQAAREGANVIYEFLDRYDIDYKVLENISYGELMELAHVTRSDERRFQ